MFTLNQTSLRRGILRAKALRQFSQPAILFVLLLLPVAALAQSGSPFDTGFTALQNLFTVTVAKVASLIAIVIGGYQFAHGEPESKKALAGVAAGTGIAVLAVNVLSWLWESDLPEPNGDDPTFSNVRGVRCTHTANRRHRGPQRQVLVAGAANRVYKSLHKALAYLGVERTLRKPSLRRVPMAQLEQFMKLYRVR